MLQEKFTAAIKSFTQDTCIAGLSGGLDSVVLLHLLAEYRNSHAPKIKIIAAHLNHGLRGTASDTDEDFCKKLCDKLGVIYCAKKLSEGALGDSALEEKGRNSRHEFFAELCAKHKTKTVILAHHADDQAETLLMRIMRGAGLRGMCGMRQLTHFADFNILRPLLDIRKNELKYFAEENKTTWREDASNSDNSFLRNRVRNEILPKLEEINPGTSDRICENAKVLLPTYQRMLDKAKQLASEAVHEECGGILLKLEKIQTTDDDIVIELLRIVCEEMLGGGDLAYANYTAALELIRNKSAGKVVELPHNITMRRECDGIFFIKDKREADDFEVVLPRYIYDKEMLSINAQKFVCKDFNVTIEAQLCEGDIPKSDMDDPCVEWVDGDKIEGTMLLRKRSDGDRFTPFGSEGSKKIKNMLIDLRVPNRRKENALLLCDAKNILWLWPHRLGKTASIRDNSTFKIRLAICEIKPC